jgi:hypothetical protein
MISLPLVSLAYTVSSAGKLRPYMIPIVFAGAVGFLSILAITECHGLIMGTYDTCDLQPGANSRHQLQSIAADARRRRTNYLQLPSRDSWSLAIPHDPANGGAVAPQEGAGHSESCVRDAAQYGRRRR